jgi:hypothetical protein
VFRLEVKKAIKKVVALGAGAVMVGTTIMGAMAASLADYPAPFVSDGKFNGYIVVGDNAKAEDIIGATDIIASLQYQMKTSSTVSSGTGTTVVIEGDSWKAESTSKKLELGEAMNSIQTKLTDADLNALAGGSAKAKNTADYEQEISLPGSLGLTYAEDTDNDVVGAFLKISGDAEVLAYKMTFETALESDIDGTSLEDLEDASLNILGKEYAILDTSYTAPSLTLTLMGGAVNDILEEKQTKTYTIDGKDYEVTVSYIGTDSAKLTVNGEVSNNMEAGDSEDVGGISVGIRDVLAQNLAGEVDTVEFYLGADKVTLKDTAVNDTAYAGVMTVGDETMDNAFVGIKATIDTSTVKLESIQLNYTSDDTYWVAAGKKLSDYVDEPQAFINWDVAFEGMSEASSEAIEISPSGDDTAILKVVLADGSVSVPLAYSSANGTVYVGDSDNRLALNYSKNIVEDQYFVLTTGSANDVEDGSYLLQYTGADSSAGDTTATLKFKNIASKSTIERSFSIGGTGTMNLGGEEFTISNTSNAAAGTDDFNISITGGAASDLATPIIVTEDNAKIVITDPNGQGNDLESTGIAVVISEVDAANMMQDGTENDVKVLVGASDTETSGEVTIGSPNLTMITDPDDSDVKTAMTTYGALFTFTAASSGPDKVVVSWPAAQLVGQAFITSGATQSVSSGSAGGIVTEEIVKIDVGAAVLASEVAGEETANNLILVGGPCANAAASVVMGNPENCAEGFEAGKAKIKLYTHANGKVALLVAGDQAMDTRGACQYIANFDKNTAMFEKATDEIALTVTSLSQISASIPTSE